MPDLVTTRSEEQLVGLFTALAACDGSVRLACRRLDEAGTDITEGELKILREQHSGMYQAIAVERSQAQEEAIAQEFRETVRSAQMATRTFVDQLNQDIEDGTLTGDQKRAMPQIIQALAKVQQVGTDKLLALTGRPTDGKQGDPLAAAAELVKMGILKPVDRPSIDSTATEVQP